LSLCSEHCPLHRGGADRQGTSSPLLLHLALPLSVMIDDTLPQAPRFSAIGARRCRANQSCMQLGRHASPIQEVRSASIQSRQRRQQHVPLWPPLHLFLRHHRPTAPGQATRSAEVHPYHVWRHLGRLRSPYQLGPDATSAQVLRLAKQSPIGTTFAHPTDGTKA